MPSFDVVSQVNFQEVDNAVNQALKELAQRYDFRGSKSTIEFDKQGKKIILLADDDMKLKALREILNQRMVKRGIGVRVLDYGEPTLAAGEALRQAVSIKEGVSGDDARRIAKLVKELKLKSVQAEIQQDQVRVRGPKKDDLQRAIQEIKAQVSDLELQFVNFKD